MGSGDRLQSTVAQGDPDRANRFQTMVDAHINTLYPGAPLHAGS